MHCNSPAAGRRRPPGPVSRQVLATDPYQLFSFAGVRRLDAVLDVAAGRVDIAAYILDEDAGEEADVG